jgi:hypothetical protein
MRLKVKVLSVGMGSIELELSNGRVVSLPAKDRGEEVAFAAHLYEETTLDVALPGAAAKEVS